MYKYSVLPFPFTPLFAQKCIAYRTPLSALMFCYINIGISIFLMIIIRAMRSLNGFRYLPARSNNFKFLSAMLTLFPLYNAASLAWDEYCHLKIFIHWDITTCLTGSLENRDFNFSEKWGPQWCQHKKIHFGVSLGYVCILALSVITSATWRKFLNFPEPQFLYLNNIFF